MTPAPLPVPRVLVVDDEQSLAEVLASVLRREGWDARTAHTGAGAVTQARTFRPHVVVLDIMLPDVLGLDVLPRLREIDPAVCVLFLTARDAVEDRIAGLLAGGDDYVIKPFSLDEVMARLNGMARRAIPARRAAAPGLCRWGLDARRRRARGDPWRRLHRADSHRIRTAALLHGAIRAG